MLDTANLKDLDDDGSDSDDAGEMPVFGRATMKRHSEAIIDQAIQEEIESQDILVVNGKKLDVPAKGTNNRLPTPSRSLSTEEPDEDESDHGEEEDEQAFLEAQKKNAKVASQAPSAGAAGVAKVDAAAAAVEVGAASVRTQEPPQPDAGTQQAQPKKPPQPDAAAAYAAARAAPAASIGVAVSVPAGPGVARTRATPRSAGLQAVPRPTNV